MINIIYINNNPNVCACGLVWFENEEFEFEIRFWLSQSQVAQNRDQKIEKRWKIDSYEFLILNMVYMSRNKPNLLRKLNYIYEATLLSNKPQITF